jgi:hypothetical protein
MSALTPGLYKATIFGKDRVGLVDGDGDFTYNNAFGESVQTPVSPRRVEDNLRPLIVLDLNGIEDIAIEDLRYAANALSGHDLHRPFLFDIANQIREQTKPARIPESPRSTPSSTRPSSEKGSTNSE